MQTLRLSCNQSVPSSISGTLLVIDHVPHHDLGMPSCAGQLSPVSDRGMGRTSPPASPGRDSAFWRDPVAARPGRGRTGTPQESGLFPTRSPDHQERGAAPQKSRRPWWPTGRAAPTTVSLPIWTPGSISNLAPGSLEITVDTEGGTVVVRDQGFLLEDRRLPGGCRSPSRTTLAIGAPESREPVAENFLVRLPVRGEIVGLAFVPPFTPAEGDANPP